MINISYNPIPQAYLDFIDRFKKKIEKWYDDGYMGNQRALVNLTPECKVIFRYLKTGENLKNFLLTDADKLPDLIDRVERKYPCLSLEVHYTSV